ncbi:MAG TPA: amidohydrolase family protein [Ramlibacter sp.]|nr:amidohydrolase family protein [Ramlibacter sp.]
MPIDVHAHLVPPSILDRLAQMGPGGGVEVIGRPPACQQCLSFAYGLKARPFFSRLVEPMKARLDHMDGQGITRQVLSIWTDIFGYGLPARQGGAWHRLMNEELAAWCEPQRDRFSWLASGHLPDGASAARELERAVREGGAVGGVVAANAEGTNLGDLPLDDYWAAACELDVPVFIHPAQPDPPARVRRYALNPIVQYTYDTTLAIGSLISSGVMDRFPELRLITSHGGGTFPYLAGRFDCLHQRTAREASGNQARHKPSAYLSRFHYDTLLHNPAALRFLAQSVGVGALVLGTDDSFPPADEDPLGSLRAAQFTGAEIDAIAERNPRQLFRF